MDEVSLGNAKADTAAKAAALTGTESVEIFLATPCSDSPDQIDLTVLEKLQVQTDEKTKQKWRDQGCRETDGLWAHEDDEDIDLCEGDGDPKDVECLIPGIFPERSNDSQSTKRMFVDLDTETYEMSITNLTKGLELWRIKCKNSKLYPVDPTGENYEGWFIVYIIFNQGEEREHKRYYYDFPELVQGSLADKCFHPAEGTLEILITKNPTYNRKTHPLNYLSKKKVVLQLNCSNAHQAMWYERANVTLSTKYTNTVILKIRTDTTNKRYKVLDLQPRLSIHAFVLQVMRETCDPDIEGHYFIDTAYWPPNQSLAFNSPNPWKWDVLCNGVDLPSVNEWMNGRPMNEEMRGVHMTVDWQGPQGYDLDLDLHLDGPFVWPFCNAFDEGCWTFMQMTKLKNDDIFPGISTPVIDPKRWYAWKGRGKICVTVVWVPNELDVLVPAKISSDSCKAPIVKAADLVIPLLSSHWTVLTDTQFMLYTWRITLSDFRVDKWDKRCADFTKNQVYMLKGWLQSGYSEYSHTRVKRDLLETALGAGGVALGSLNTMDLEVLRNKLGGLAQHVGEGVKVQLDVNHILENLQHAHIDATASLSEVMKQKFTGLIAGLSKVQESIQLALSCIQVQSELSQDLRVMIASFSAGQFPLNLRKQAGRVVSQFAMSHMDWWMTQFHGCKNLTCTVSSLIQVAGTEHRAYTTVNLGTILSGSTVLHPRVHHNLMVYESGQPQMIDTDGCWLVDFGQQDEILNVLRDTEKQATIRLTHDQNRLIQVSHALDTDAKVSWWESLFGYSPNATAFLNILLHPVVVLICAALLLSLIQLIMCITIRRMNTKAMRMCTSTRYLLSRPLNS
ncbi:uncharacterized protein LOC143934794 [Lithobates pipiens]